MDISFWIIVLAIISVAGLVKGTTGFGFSLFSLPLLVYIIPIKTLVPILTLFNLFSSSQIVIQLRHLKMQKRVLVLSVSGIAGVVVGSLLLKFMSEQWLKLGISVILTILAIMFLAGYRFKIKKIKRSSIIAGFISGLLGGSTSVSGPPLALFLTSLNLDTSSFRYTFAWFSIVTASIAMFDYIKIGVLSADTFKIFFIGLPLLIICVELGKRLSKIVPQKLFYQATIIITLCAGLLMLYRCVAECFLG